MTIREMITVIEALGADVSMWEREDRLHVTIEDFAGFDDDWCEVDREYDDEEAVEAFEEMLERECVSREGDFYVTYHFDGFEVMLGYASYDI